MVSALAAKAVNKQTLLTVHFNLFAFMYLVSAGIAKILSAKLDFWTKVV
jgi:hypothetical protein